jgi:Enoyl-CoA hydratase/isomerase
MLMLIASAVVAGRAGLGILLSVAFVVQVAPAIWTLFRSARPTGIAQGTWLLVLGELACWGVYGVHRQDPRLMVMGIIGITAAVLMLVRVRATPTRPATADTSGDHRHVGDHHGHTFETAHCTRSSPDRSTIMSWPIERRGRVAVVTMTTNPVNAQNRAFFADLHDAFDRLERDHTDSPVVLTGTGTRFSAGLDLGEHFPLFAGDPAAVPSWFRDYRATNMRLFTYRRPTVAAVNGHAFAGGLITAAVCDHRVAVDDDARFGLNEVPIGIPMPAVYVRMLAYAWGEPVAARTCLLGEIFSPCRGARPRHGARPRPRRRAP